MIFTIGYDHLTLPELVATYELLRCEQLIDCRSVPMSRRPGFGRHQLEAAFGEKYLWAGLTLGGRGAGPIASAIKGLRETQFTSGSPMRLLLLCKEEAPGDCHRHRTIAVPLYRVHGVDCYHVFRDVIIAASELQAAVEENRDYEYTDLTPAAIEALAD